MIKKIMTCSQVEDALGIKGRILYISKIMGKSDIVIEYKKHYDDSNQVVSTKV